MNRYYIQYWNPNGTNDLIITDEDSQIVACIPEATFGINVPLSDSIGGIAYTCGDFIGYAQHGDASEGIEEAMNSGELSTDAEPSENHQFPGGQGLL